MKFGGFHSERPHDCFIIPEGMFQSLHNSTLRYIDMSSIGINRIYGNWPLPYLKNLKLNDNPNFVHESFGIFHPVFFPRLTQLNTQNTSMDGIDFKRLIINMRGSQIKQWQLDRNIMQQTYQGYMIICLKVFL